MVGNLEAIDAKFELREDFEPSGPRFATLGMWARREIFWEPFSALSRFPETAYHLSYLTMLRVRLSIPSQVGK